MDSNTLWPSSTATEEDYSNQGFQHWDQHAKNSSRAVWTAKSRLSKVIAALASRAASFSNSRFAVRLLVAVVRFSCLLILVQVYPCFARCSIRCCWCWVLVAARRADSLGHFTCCFGKLKKVCADLWSSIVCCCCLWNYPVVDSAFLVLMLKICLLQGFGCWSLRCCWFSAFGVGELWVNCAPSAEMLKLWLMLF
ncbi:hypothetical protein Nepgr_022677 [Nepenthes gracilis]|uniref:Uncharacterized protein n=1 Tax=Nepenthes gracilis TaxID=150966 RepID=A0AAD3XYE0_NEPGR|nr:hypothetical protein Nepgr_022677 [Nepenthes gracilis]